eukprot:TRINITY_DN64130_c0_g1_i1.p1 TRINITY_DN64130_c0_g1~~TRINITY_DN64130_c0_g1_i1.p1  ORF type:complete len:365 (+),score=98.34 TRINITY_DN64130_c0_g1_i1:130-1095(+)
MSTVMLTTDDAVAPTAPTGGKRRGVSVRAFGGPKIQPPNPSDPPFMQTASPSGMSWGQYVTTTNSFIDPKTGFLAGPWGECIAWGVVFEHANDWANDPQYAADGPVGGILQALEKACSGDAAIMGAGQKLEDASHALAERDEPLPAIKQAVTLPANAVPGQPCKIQHPQMPGSYQTIVCPAGGVPGQQIPINAPVQPTKTGKTGMSTGSKVAFATGAAVVVGATAGVAYYATEGGGFDGFVADASTAGEWMGAAAGDAGEWAAGAGEDVAAWAPGAFEDASDAVGGAAESVGEWAPGAAEDAAEWTTGAVDDIGDALSGLF